MQIKKKSYFKNTEADSAWFNDWAKRVESASQRHYKRMEIETVLGKTLVWNLAAADPQAETLVIFPGARTSALFWDFDKGLDNFGIPLNIYLVETNGLPNTSDGGTPSIRSLDYGIWAADVLDTLNIAKTFVAGASFGGLICMKLGIVHPEKIKAAFLLNPGCLQPFSLSLSNLYYNLLPILAPSKKNILAFLDKAVFCKPTHQLSKAAEELAVDYELFALTRYKDTTEKPYYMAGQLKDVKADTYLLEGTKDLLFPFQKSVDNAREKVSRLKDVVIYENVGHGIETFSKALAYVGSVIKNYK